MSPGLKLLKGDMFSEKQWAGMLDVVGIPYQSIETIKFKEFLIAREQIIQNSEQIRVCIYIMWQVGINQVFNFL
jgi:hypothetical protein